MANSIEMSSTDDQILRIPLIKRDEIEEGSKVGHPSNINQIFAKKFNDLGNSSIQSCTIFKVNKWVRESSPTSYTPKMVSIGPYHKKNPQLHQMEEYKLLYLQQFLGRKEGLDVESCISELKKLKKKAINCYEDVETNKFDQMLLLDGCFVVEFIRELQERKDKIINDNIVGYIVRDLMLLENQLPFFILNKLHDMTKRDDELALARLASMIILHPCFFKSLETIHKTFLESIAGNIAGNIKHLLHLKHEISCLGLPRPVVTSNATGLCAFIEARGCFGKDNDDQTWHMVMPNATELSEAGASFAKASVETSIFDSIKFENGLMKIPQFKVTDDAETLLRNLIAYEQNSVNVEPKYYSDFAIFMDKLIESDKDVNLLRQKGIIENWLGDDKEVANLFNKIGNAVLITHYGFHYIEVCRKAVKHCKIPWNKHRANFLRNYCSSPWVVASTVAAILLLILTLIQTIPTFIDLFIK